MQTPRDEGSPRLRDMPVTSMILSSWFMVEVPGKMGLPKSNSPNMQPARRSKKSTALSAAVCSTMHEQCDSCTPFASHKMLLERRFYMPD
jgi:hypothetical protein